MLVRAAWRGIEVRKTPAELVEGLDAGKPILVLDHQPRELEALAAGACRVLEGHERPKQFVLPDAQA